MSGERGARGRRRRRRDRAQRAWWLARSGVDVLVLEKGIVGWEASGRNGGGATHVYSPLGVEEQRLWPQMDELLGYPTEHMPHRIRVAYTRAVRPLSDHARIAAERGFRTSARRSRSRSSSRSSATTRSAASTPLRRPRQPAAHGPGLCVGAPGSRRAHPPAHACHGFQMAGGRVTAVETAAGPSAATRWSSRPGRRPTASPPGSASACRWRRRGSR